MFQYPIPEHTLEEWIFKVAADSYTSVLLSKAMILSLLDPFSSGDHPLEDHGEPRRRPLHQSLA